jgi:putative transcriptional regulator
MSQLAPGLLVAAPPLGDPNFERSVVLLAAHSEEGAFGWVINGQELMTITELLSRADAPKLSGNVAPGIVRAGGPVGKEQVWLLYRTQDRIAGLDDQMDVGFGITASSSRKLLTRLAASTTCAKKTR